MPAACFPSVRRRLLFVQPLPQLRQLQRRRPQVLDEPRLEGVGVRDRDHDPVGPARHRGVVDLQGVQRFTVRRRMARVGEYDRAGLLAEPGVAADLEHPVPLTGRTSDGEVADVDSRRIRERL